MPELSLKLSLQESVRHWARYEPLKTAVLCDTRVVTYGDLNAMADSLAAALHSQVNGTQARIAVLCSDKAKFLAAVIGVLRAGDSVVILNGGWSHEQQGTAITDAGCVALIAEAGPDRQPTGSSFDLPTVIRVADACDVSHTSALPPSAQVPRDLRWVWGVIYSSGTTGRPKGIVRTDISILTELLGWCMELPIARTTVFYIARPLFYTGGLLLAASTLLAGGTVIAPSEHTAPYYWQVCREWSVDFAFFIPHQIESLVQSRRLAGSDVRGAKAILTMGGPISLESKLAIRDVLGSAPIESWGNSEGLGTIAGPSELKARPGSIGRPFLTDEMMIVDEDGNECPPGHVGRIAGIADSRMREYQNRDDLNRLLLKGDLLISEDLGYMDPEGYFYVVGRVDERIVRRGHPVFSSDIETALALIPSVAESVVVGLNDANEGQVPAAAVVLKGGASADENEFLNLANRALPSLQQLVRARLVPLLPRNPAGKPDRQAVRQLFQECDTRDHERKIAD